MHGAFSGAENVDLLATDTPDLSNVSSLSQMFRYAANLIGASANWNWDTSNITNMSYTFSRASNFNQPINSWDTSNVTTMEAMLHRTSNFNQPLDSWDTSKVLNMSELFHGASVFNQSLVSWNTSSVTNMNHTFASASRFNQSLNSWSTDSVTNMMGTFNGATFFNNGEPLGSSTNPLNWNTENVTNMSYMFRLASAFNKPVGNWSISNVISTAFMFNGATDFNQFIGNWDTGNVINMNSMFHSASSFNQDIGNWDTSKVTLMNSMFLSASIFNNGEPAGESNNPLNWSTANVVDMASIFNTATSFNQFIGNWDTNKVSTMSGLFRLARSFNQEISSWDTGNVVNFQSIFSSATSFNNGQVAGSSTAPLNWDTSSVENMLYAFQNASSFNQSLDSWDTSKISATESMFSLARLFDQPLSSWDVSSVTNATNMFLNAGLSTPNYDATLKSWSTQPLQPGASFHGGNSTYCLATPERAEIIANFSWTITDAGSDCTAYSVTYNANGSTSGTAPATTHPTSPNFAVTISDQATLEKTGYILTSWNTNPDGTGTIYNPGDTYSFTTPDTPNLTLYAQWQDITPPTLTIETEQAETIDTPSPQLNGTIDDTNATITVTINNQTYTATNNQDGTWTPPQGTIASLTSGEYTITVTATDQANNQATQEVTLIIELPVTPEPENPQEPTEPGQIEEDEPEKPQEGEVLSETGMDLIAPLVLGLSAILLGWVFIYRPTKNI